MVSAPLPDSASFKMTQENWEDWARNTIIFIRPLAILYLGTLAATLAVPGKSFNIADFAPHQTFIGACELYLVNSLYDWLRKFSSSGKSS